jgi:hypothetical protein
VVRNRPHVLDVPRKSVARKLNVAGSIGGTNAGPDIAAAGIGAGLGYGAHKAIQAAGGYGKIAGMAGDAGAVLKGRMIEALRRAAAKVAQAEI